MKLADKLEKIINEAFAVMDHPSSAKLAEYLAEHGVVVEELPLEVGTTVYKLIVKERKSNGRVACVIAVSLYHLKSAIENNADICIEERPFAKSDSKKLGYTCFRTYEQAEAKLKEYLKIKEDEYGNDVDGG